MTLVRTFEGQINAAGKRFGIVAARFNSFIVEHLISGAVDTIVRHGGSKNDISLVHVPGSFEIPLACKKLAESGKLDALVALGAVIRGATSHYDLICAEVTRGIAAIMRETGVPIGFGVITADTIEQAIERAGTKAGNKGVEAALAAIEMSNVIRIIDKGEV